MGAITVRNPGVGALRINFGGVSLFVDAFNSINTAEEVNNGDVILFTHDDADHFDAGKLPDIREIKATIIGPPSIVKPILEKERAELKQIVPVYSQNNKNPATIKFEDFTVTSFSTPHFLDWKPIHNSYLFKHQKGNIYVTGDSYLTREMKDTIGKVDYVICNLVDEGFITRTEDPMFAIHHHLSCMLNIVSVYQPRKIIGVHLIHFDGTVDAGDMKKIVNAYGFEQIIIPTDEAEAITL